MKNLFSIFCALTVFGNSSVHAALLKILSDNLEIRGKGFLDSPNVNIMARDGDLSSNNTSSFSLDGTVNANVVDVNGATWTNTGNGVSTGAVYRCNLGAGSGPTTNCP